jgi:L-fuconolactonase
MSAPAVPVTDSQVHLFPPASNAAASAFGHRIITPDDLISEMDLALVSRAILIPPRIGAASNEASLAAAAQWPERLGVVGKISLDEPSWRPAVGRWPTTPLLGLRLSFPADVPGPADAALHGMWEAAETGGIPMMVWSPARLAELELVARRYPGLRIAVDHCGLGAGDRGRDAERCLPALAALAECPNVCVKVSALPGHSLCGYPFADLHPFVATLASYFGARRMFWGSDLSGLRCSYREAVTMFTDALTCFSADELAWVMGRSISDWLDWRPAA